MVLVVLVWNARERKLPDRWLPEASWLALRVGVLGRQGSVHAARTGTRYGAVARRIRPFRVRALRERLTFPPASIMNRHREIDSITCVFNSLAEF